MADPKPAARVSQTAFACRRNVSKTTVTEGALIDAAFRLLRCAWFDAWKDAGICLFVPLTLVQG